MAYILMGAGVFCVCIALLLGYYQNYRLNSQLNQFRQLKGELLEAKQDVTSLLAQLEEVSEQVVEELSDKISEMRKITKLPDSTVALSPRKKKDKDITSSAKYEMVGALDKLGYSCEEIAKQLKIGKGEVMLILQLRRKGEQAHA